MNTLNFKNWIESTVAPVSTGPNADVKDRVKMAIQQASNQPGVSSKEVAKQELDKAQQSVAADPESSIADVVDIATASDKIKGVVPRQRMKKR